MGGNFRPIDMVSLGTIATQQHACRQHNGSDFPIVIHWQTLAKSAALVW